MLCILVTWLRILSDDSLIFNEAISENTVDCRQVN